MARTTLILLTALLGLVVLTAGCDSGAADPVLGAENDLETAMADVALESDRMTAELIGNELDALGTPSATDGSGTVTIEKSFSATRSCPGGGELSVEGMMLITFDAGTGVMEAEMSGSRMRTDCTFLGDGFTVTVNGSSMWEKFRRRVHGVPDGPQTSHYYGSWVAVSSEGEERSCEFDYTVVRDPDSHTLTIEGSICGKEISLIVSWDIQH